MKTKQGWVYLDKKRLSKNITMDKEYHYIHIKGSIHQEYVTIINIYATNTGAPKHIKQVLTDLKGEIDTSTVTVGDFITHFQKRLVIQKENQQEVLDLNHTLEQMDLIDIYRTFHPIATEYINFLSVHSTFFRTDNMIDHKISLSK